MFEVGDKRATNQGFGDAMSRSFEVVITPLLFGLLGLGLDRWLGLQPVLTVSLSVFGVVGVFARLWITYEAEMRAHEERFAARAAKGGRPR